MAETADIVALLPAASSTFIIAAQRSVAGRAGTRSSDARFGGSQTASCASAQQSLELAETVVAIEVAEVAVDGRADVDDQDVALSSARCLGREMICA